MDEASERAEDRHYKTTSQSATHYHTRLHTTTHDYTRLHTTTHDYTPLHTTKIRESGWRERIRNVTGVAVTKEGPERDQNKREKRDRPRYVMEKTQTESKTHEKEI